MKLEIITPEKHIFEGEADLVQLPGSDGLFEILKNHAPMIASLGKGRTLQEILGKRWQMPIILSLNKSLLYTAPRMFMC